MSDNEEVMFSVEVTTYNQRDYIAQTLQSIIDQKHGYKYEILVSDDCSTDGTQDVIEEFQKKHPDVVKPVYNKKNLGAMANYYATVARAKGKYLMGCGGDDYWLPGKVKKQIEFMERNLDFAICYGKSECADMINKKNLSNIGENYVDFRDLITKGNNCPALTICARKCFFDAYLDEVKPQKKDWLMEDYPFLIYTAFNSKIFFFDDIFSAYRIINDSISHQTCIERREMFKKSVLDIKKYYFDLYLDRLNTFQRQDLEREFSGERDSTKLLYSILKKTIKYIVPYGVIELFRKKRLRKKGGLI